MNFCNPKSAGEKHPCSFTKNKSKKNTEKITEKGGAENNRKKITKKQGYKKIIQKNYENKNFSYWGRRPRNE
jgi:hypothetical protein